MLVADAEGADAVDVVAEELEARGFVGAEGEEVDDAAADRELAGEFDGVDAFVFRLDEAEREAVGHEAVAFDEADAGGVERLRGGEFFLRRAGARDP